MFGINAIISRSLSVLVLAVAPMVALADSCGEAPQPPEILDGTKSSMEELVANSQSVKAYISDADSFLDCRESFAQTEDFKAQSTEQQEEQIKTNAEVLASRNGIGDAFNKEVAAYKAANP